MTLADLPTGELEKIKSSMKHKAFTKLVQSRIDDIKEREWGTQVVSDNDKVRLAKAQGMAEAWGAFLALPEVIDDELELRSKEEEKLAGLGKK